MTLRVMHGAALLKTDLAKGCAGWQPQCDQLIDDNNLL